MLGNGTSKQNEDRLVLQSAALLACAGLDCSGHDSPGDNLPEVNRLNALLIRQTEETMRAIQAGNQLREELDVKHGELTALQGKAEMDLASLPDFSGLLQKFENTENELELERRNHQSDPQQAVSRIAGLESALSTSALVKEHAALVPGKAPSPKIPGTADEREACAARWRIVFVVVILSFAVTVVAVAMRTNTLVLQSLTIWDVKEEPPKQPEPPPKKPGPPDSGQIGEIRGRSSEFSSAVSRLDRALASFPGRPEDILNAVHNQKSPTGESNCDFVWENGQPALLYEAGKAGFSISASMNNCADAIQHFRENAEKDVSLDRDRKAGAK